MGKLTEKQIAEIVKKYKKQKTHINIQNINLILYS